MKFNIVLAGALFLALLATAVVIIELVRVPDMYAVEGHGSIKYRPDSARISVGFVAKADVATEATTQAANGMNKVLRALKAAGVLDADIASNQIDAGPTTQPYNPAGNAERLPNFSTVQTVTVTVRDLSRLPVLLNTVAAAGANYWHVDYFIADEAGLKRKARAAALADAMERADSYAGKGGFTRGRILKIQEGQAFFPYVDYGARSFITGLEDGSIALALPAPAVMVPREAVAVQAVDFAVPRPQEATVDASVNVLFEIR